MKYVNNNPTVNNPLGFIRSKLKLALQQHVSGDKISFSELQISSRLTGRKEVIPDWFNERDEPKETREMTEKELEKKRKFLEKRGKSPEEIEEKMKENRMNVTG